MFVFTFDVYDRDKEQDESGGYSSKRKRQVDVSVLAENEAAALEKVIGLATREVYILTDIAEVSDTYHKVSSDRW